MGRIRRRGKAGEEKIALESRIGQVLCSFVDTEFGGIFLWEKKEEEENFFVQTGGRRRRGEREEEVAAVVAAKKQ